MSRKKTPAINDGDEKSMSEIEILESIFEKLSRLATLACGENVMQNVGDIDDEGQGVLVEMMQVEVHPSGGRRPSIISNDEHASCRCDTEHNDDFPSGGAPLPFSRDVINTWGFNILE
eukprot:CAMPEP_0117558306 /NCGR_PEP_ID=MMETSP0784-20121206/52765_1 /TAXON_ID=39447 /ORGANISM="" /LENGTH=117 /DNA_ID=CAMNT_0005355625 /DNA_START=246 /DNA_END=596 /DNA_ORIENTATION=+